MSAPSWNAVLTLARKQKAKYAKGRKRENVNDYTIWYYGNETAAPFCFIGISWTLAHAADTEADGLALIGGQHAYVPDIRSIHGYHAGHSGMKVGAIVAVNSFNHIGFCTAISGSTFTLLSFNSTSGGSDDAVTEKTYSLSSASGYVNLAYGSGSAEEDDMGEYVSVDKNDKSRQESLTPGKWQQVYFNKNNSKAAAKHHAVGDYPSFVQGGHYYNGIVNLRIKGLPKGVEGQVRAVYTDAKSNAEKAHCYISEFVGTDGDTFVTHPAVGYVPTGQKCRIEVVVYGSANDKPKVIEGQVRLFVK